jgi:DNA-binding MarR family transcriptional regulator
LKLSSIEVVEYLAGVAPSSTAADGGLAVAHEIAGLLFRVTEQTRHVFESAARRFELTPPQARALLELDSPTSMRAVAEALHCDASNITGIADRLEARGLVSRQIDPADRRIKALVLTPRGRRARTELEDAVRSSPAMAGLTEAERLALRDLLGKIAGAGRC